MKISRSPLLCLYYIIYICNENSDNCKITIWKKLHMTTFWNLYVRILNLSTICISNVTLHLFVIRCIALLSVLCNLSIVLDSLGRIKRTYLVAHPCVKVIIIRFNIPYPTIYYKHSNSLQHQFFNKFSEALNYNHPDLNIKVSYSATVFSRLLKYNTMIIFVS